MPYGRHLVTVHHATSGSIKMKEPSSVPFITSDPDYTPPNIVDEKCDPKNGALDVNPDDYPQ